MPRATDFRQKSLAVFERGGPAVDPGLISSKEKEPARRHGANSRRLNLAERRLVEIRRPRGPTVDVSRATRLSTL